MPEFEVRVAQLAERQHRRTLRLFAELTLAGMAIFTSLIVSHSASATPPASTGAAKSTTSNLIGVEAIKPLPAAHVRPILYSDFDANADGVMDTVAIRNPDATHSMSRAAVISGADNSILFVINSGDVTKRLQRLAPSAGDVNGDGRSDLLLIKTPTQSTPEASRHIEVLIQSGNNGELLHTFTSPEPMDAFGAAAPVGDINGDGFDDVAIGAPMGGSENQGRLYIYSGGTGDLIRVHTGDAPQSALGASVIDLGDVTGDDRPDYAAAAPSLDPDVPGRVLLFDGETGAVIRTLTGAVGEMFGARLAALPDMNRNGVAELVVAAPGAQTRAPGSTTRGAVLIYDGAAGNLIRTLKGETGYEFGVSLSTSESDQDDDGVPELIVAALPTDDPSDAMRMTLNVISPASGATLVTFTLADLINPQFAMSDLNHDGLTDTFDLQIMLGSFGQTPGKDTPSGSVRSSADLNGDGVTDAMDLAVLLSDWNTESAPEARAFGQVGKLCGLGAGAAGLVILANLLCPIGCAYAAIIPYGAGYVACGACALFESLADVAGTASLATCGIDLLF